MGFKSNNPALATVALNENQPRQVICILFSIALFQNHMVFCFTTGQLWAHIGRTTLFLFNMVEPSDASGKCPASVCLTEDGIPGAKLPKGSPKECNCWMLRRWLQCRGGRTMGKKAALVQK